MAAVDDLNLAITQLTFNTYNNAPISQLLIKQLQAVAGQLSPGVPLSQLQDSISRLQLAAPNNASAPISLFKQLTNVSSQLTFGPQTTNPPDVQAIGQLTNAILALEPDWAPLLWINWDGATNLTTQVRGIATLVMPIAASPWWSNWPNFPFDAAGDIIGAIYLQQMAGPAAGFDQQYSSPDITVSANTLTTTRTGQTYTVTIPGAGVPPQSSLSAFSKISQVYAEVKMHKLKPFDNGVGVSNSAQDLTTAYQSWLGSPGSNSIGYYDNGQVYLNNALVATIGGYNDGDVIGVAVDCVAMTVAFINVTQSGSLSPAYNISALGPAPYRLGVTVYAVGESGTANFVGPFIGTPPSGFGTWK